MITFLFITNLYYSKFIKLQEKLEEELTQGADLLSVNISISSILSGTAAPENSLAEAAKKLLHVPTFI